MPEKDDLTQSIYRAVHDLLPEMDESLRAQVETLLARAKRGEKTDNLLVELVSANKRLRPRLRKTLANAERTLSYTPFVGEKTSTPGQVFTCPKCGYRYIIGEAGETPPPCPTHHEALIRANKEAAGEKDEDEKKEH